MNKKNLSLLGLALAIVLFFAVNITANATLRAVRVDLTEDKVYTLDEGSKAIAKNIDEPIHLYFYCSRSAASDYPQVLEYADRILGILREYERASGGNLELTVIDPEPFSEEEDRAVEQGIQGAPLPSGDPLYFGLLGTNATGAKEAIPFFSLDEDKQRTLEYDLSKVLWTLAHPDKKKVGILTAMPLEGGGGNPMMGQQGEPRWAFLDQLGDFFEVEVLPGSSDTIDASVDILMVVHPRGFSDATLYLIDQWALAGKPLLVFVDPQCDVDAGQSDDPSNPMSRFTAKKDSNLESLFQAWGFELAKNKIACDKALGVLQDVPSQDRRTSARIPLVFVPRLTEKELDREDPITRLLTNILLWTPGSLKQLADGATTFTPILQTSEESQEVDSMQFQFQAQPRELLASFVPGFEKLTLAARVTGNVKSAFPGGKPGAAPEGETPSAEGEPKTGGLSESSAPLNLVAFADVDMLHDRLWMQELGRLPGGQVLVKPISENVDLLKNAIESVSGGKELMSIRMRGKTSRPFERVQEIQRDADQRLLARQQELERKVQDAERRLGELQKAKSEGSEELVTADQRKEREKVREEFVQARRDLRDVEHSRRQDTERLGTTLKVLNIAIVPILVCIVAVGLGAARIKRRTRK
ncbi:MAG: hypothetical protein EXS08_00105 [Planctomycetes bacterium]|nr:hypothetical protein [Planctomycetota bacterium]